MNMVPYASAVGSSMNKQVWYYPKVIHISGLFLAISSPDIDHWNGVKCIGHAKLERTSTLKKLVSTKIELVKCIAKSTIVANIHTWSFCVEKLQRIKQLSLM